VTKHERTIWDDLVELGREIVDKIDEALNPEKKRRKPARVPVPVHNDRPNPNSYNDQH